MRLIPILCVMLLAVSSYAQETTEACEAAIELVEQAPPETQEAAEELVIDACEPEETEE